MIYLRKLREEDAPYMIEWMHDLSYADAFQKDMKDITLEQAKDFCKKGSHKHQKISELVDMHFAIVEEDNEYLGTISLKNIDMKNNNAEYAICLRKKAQGRGIAKAATMELLRRAFEEYQLHKVYLSVFAENKRAIKLYEESGFVYEGESRDSIKKGEEYRNLKLYSILISEYFESKANPVLSISTGGGIGQDNYFIIALHFSCFLVDWRGVA